MTIKHTHAHRARITATKIPITTPGEIAVGGVPPASSPALSPITVSSLCLLGGDGVKEGANVPLEPTGLAILLGRESIGILGTTDGHFK
mmetsp:Transcript_24402/g.52752  ORF Transcript_24402/g.52752 Transcript_24402/m.52752 type:complete len:89 (+) Transcript_24402:340-606(+)